MNISNIVTGGILGKMNVFCVDHVASLKLTASSHLKMDAWKIRLPFWGVGSRPIFSGLVCLVSGRVCHIKLVNLSVRTHPVVRFPRAVHEFQKHPGKLTAGTQSHGGCEDDVPFQLGDLKVPAVGFPEGKRKQ